MHIRTKTHLGVVAKSIEFLHKDHTGSIEAITDINGNVLVQMSFDAFGSRRKTNWVGSLGATETASLLAQVGVGTSRGYTGHEHLDRTGFIHMNGRVYDPALGRFLSPDPLVQAPYFSQSYNRYTYVWNNPMGMTDPSGYTGTDPFGKEEKKKDPDHDIVVVEGTGKESGKNYDIYMTAARAQELGAIDEDGNANEGGSLTVSGSGTLVQVNSSSSGVSSSAQASSVTAQKQGETISQVARGDRFEFATNNKGEAFPEDTKAAFILVASSLKDIVTWGSDETVRVFYNPDFGLVATRAHGIAYRTDTGIEIVLGRMSISSGLFRSIVAEEIYHAADFTKGLLYRGISQVSAWEGEVRAQNFLLDNRMQINFSRGRADELKNYLRDYKSCINGNSNSTCRN